MNDVVVYSKPGCCLCDEVKENLKRLKASYAFNLREVNILEDPEAHERFKEEIPVVFINGKKAFKYHLDEKQFLKKLQSARG
ncbi:MAG: glutaredoxin family protein [Terriglobia bacterium]|jgi:glutaredoxin